MEFINGFLEAWGVVRMPSLEDVGFAAGIVSVLARALIVAVTGLFVLTEAWAAFKRKVWPRPFIPNTRPPPK